MTIHPSLKRKRRNAFAYASGSVSFAAVDWLFLFFHASEKKFLKTKIFRVSRFRGSHLFGYGTSVAFS
jgi:hypothetical protein